MSRVLVHGAGGFLGGAILRALAAAPGLSPLACVRRPPPRPLAAPHVLCDATDPQAVAAAMAGVGAGVGAEAGAIYAVNCVLGSPATMLAATRTLCDAARAAGLRRIVHISTMSVYGSAEGLVAETAPLAATGAYGAAKLGCEAIVRGFIAAGGEAVILRPGIVHGPGGQQWVGRMGRLLSAGRLGDLGAHGDGFCNLVYHDDVAAAVVASLTAPGVAGEAINLGPQTPPTWNEFLVRLGCLIGATPIRRITARRLRTEARLLAPPLQAAKLAAARLGLRPGALPEPIPPSLLSLLRQRIALDPAKADAVLGLRRTDPQDALAASAAWFRQAAA